MKNYDLLYPFRFFSTLSYSTVKIAYEITIIHIELRIGRGLEYAIVNKSTSPKYELIQTQGNFRYSIIVHILLKSYENF